VNKAGWTELSDVVALLRKRWDSGRYLRAHAQREPWEPVRVPLKGPAANDLLERLDDVRGWSAALEKGAQGGRAARGATAGFEIEYRQVRGRNLGSNRVPARICVASFDQLCSLLGTAGDVSELDALLVETARRSPGLVPWVAQHPLEALAHGGSWDRVLATIEWMAANDTAGVYLRQIDVEGVDTKFIERHERLLTRLLPIVGPEVSGASAQDGAWNGASTTGDFARRFGFLAKPSYTRFRLLGDAEACALPAGLTELTLRTDELARMELGISTVFVIENEVSYLAFPVVPRAIAVFGSGFASSRLSELPWLMEKDVVYWGDIDTHGFAILDRLRGHLPHLRSMLMDCTTLLAHRAHWTREANPTTRPLRELSDEEQSVFEGLVVERYGTGVRLEQERIRFSAVRDALGSAL
jgi:hypothetical protein